MADVTNTAQAAKPVDAHGAAQAANQFHAAAYDSKESWGEKSWHETQLVCGATTKGFSTALPEVWQDFQKSLPVVAGVSVGSLMIGVAGRKFLSETAIGRTASFAGSLIWGGLSLGDMLCNPERNKVISKAWNETWNSGKNLDHSINDSGKAFARSAIDLPVVALNLYVPASKVCEFANVRFIKPIPADLPSKDLCNIGTKLLDEKNFVDARRYYERGLRLLESVKNPDEIHMANMHGKIARTILAQEALKNSESPIFKVIQSKSFDAIRPQLNRVEEMFNPPCQIEKHLDKAVQLLSKYEKTDPVEVGKKLNKFGNWAAENGEFEIASKMYGMALKVKLKNIGAGSEEVGETYKSIAQLRDAQSNTQQSGKWWTKYITLVENRLGPRAKELPAAYEQLAKCAEKRPDLKEAVRCYGRSFEIRGPERLADDKDVIGNLLLPYANALRRANPKDVPSQELAKSVYLKAAEFLKHGAPEEQLTNIRRGIIATLENMDQDDLAIQKRNLFFGPPES